MRFEGRQRAQLLDRCWSIYLWLTQTFILPESFHVEFPAAVESAIISGVLHFAVPNHVHDERRRIRSFTGQVQDFISYAKSFLTSP